jgi:hypothetical protein
VYSFIFERLDFPRVPNQMNFLSRGFTTPSRSAAVVQFETLLSLGARTWDMGNKNKGEREEKKQTKQLVRGSLEATKD